MRSSVRHALRFDLSTYTGGYKAGDKQDEKESFTDGFRLPGCARVDARIPVRNSLWDTRGFSAHR